MELIDVKASTYIDFKVESNDRDPIFKFGDINTLLVIKIKIMILKLNHSMYCFYKEKPM